MECRFLGKQKQYKNNKNIANEQTNEIFQFSFYFVKKKKQFREETI